MRLEADLGYFCKQDLSQGGQGMIMIRITITIVIIIIIIIEQMMV